MVARSSIFVVLLCAILAQALGCSCAFQTFSERYRSAKIVVKARVLSVDFVPPPPPPPCLEEFPPCLPPQIFPQPLKYKFRLLGKFKGCAPKKIFFGQSSDSSAACGVTLKKGSVYLLYLGMQKGTKKLPFGLNSCQGNVIFGRLRKGQKRFLRNQSMKKRNMCMM